MPEDALLNRDEAAAILGLKPTTLAIWACTGRNDLPYIKVGSRVRYRRTDLEEWLRRRTTGSQVAAEIGD